jgi:hypothetical protein
MENKQKSYTNNYMPEFNQRAAYFPGNTRGSIVHTSNRSFRTTLLGTLTSHDICKLRNV